MRMNGHAFEAKAPAIVRAGAYWTPRRMADEAEGLKQPKRRVPAHALEGMIEARNIVTLCPQSYAKYKSALKRANYVIKKSMPIASAVCDATGAFHPSCVLLFPKEIA